MCNHLQPATFICSKALNMDVRLLKTAQHITALKPCSGMCASEIKCPGLCVIPFRVCTLAQQVKHFDS